MFTPEIRVSSLIVAGRGVQEENIYRELARVTSGVATSVMGGPVARFRQLSSSLHNMMEGGDIVLHERNVDRKEGKTTGTFVVDSSANVNVSWVVFVADAEDHFIQSVTFTHLDTGAVHGPYRAISSLRDNINMKTVRQGLGSDSVFSLGRWGYEVRWAGAASQRQDSVIVVLSRPGQHSEGFNVRVWTSAGAGASLVTLHHPLRVTVMLERGGRPVLRARVELTLTLRSANRSQAGFIIFLYCS